MAESRPRVALVTTAWSDLRDEAAFVARRVGAALAMRYHVMVVVADGHTGPAQESADGVFGVLRVPSRRPDRRRATLALSALTIDHSGEVLPAGGLARAGAAGGLTRPGAAVATLAAPGHSASVAAALIPPGVRAQLRHLAGGSGELGAILGSLETDAVVVVDHRHDAAGLPIKALSGCRYASLVPLGWDDLALQLSLGDGVFDSWDALLATNACEAELLRNAVGARPHRAPVVHDMSVAVEPPSPEPGVDVAALVGDTNWLAVLDDPASRPGGHGERTVPEVAHLALRFPDLSLVVLRPGSTTVVRGRSTRIAGPLDLGTTWAVIAGGLATLDLRPGQVLPRQVIESLLLGTPVVVPATSGAPRCLVEKASAGLWYGSGAEMVACVAQIAEPAVRAPLAAQGRRWAITNHGDQDRFVEATCRSVLGAPCSNQ